MPKIIEIKMYANVHSIIIHKYKKWKQLKYGGNSLNGWMNKQNVACLYNGRLFDNEKKYWYMLQPG